MHIELCPQIIVLSIQNQITTAGFTYSWIPIEMLAIIQSKTIFLSILIINYMLMLILQQQYKDMYGL